MTATARRGISPKPGMTFAEEYAELDTAMDQAAALRLENAELRAKLETAERRAEVLDKRVHQLMRESKGGAGGAVYRNPGAVSINTRVPVGQLPLVAGTV